MLFIIKHIKILSIHLFFFTLLNKVWNLFLKYKTTILANLAFLIISVKKHNGPKTSTADTTIESIWCYTQHFKDPVLVIYKYSIIIE